MQVSPVPVSALHQPGLRSNCLHQKLDRLSGQCAKPVGSTNSDQCCSSAVFIKTYQNRFSGNRGPHVSWCLSPKKFRPNQPPTKNLACRSEQCQHLSSIPSSAALVVNDVDDQILEAEELSHQTGFCHMIQMFTNSVLWINDR